MGINSNPRLKDLHEKGLISDEKLKEIEDYYSSSNDNKRSKKIINSKKVLSNIDSTLIIPILGVLLIGAGIISIGAYNWKFVPSWGKVIISIIPLFSLIIALIFNRQSNSVPLIHSLAFGTGLATIFSLSIIYQVFQTPLELSTIFLIIGICMIPLAYLYDAYTLVLLSYATIFASSNDKVTMLIPIVTYLPYLVNRLRKGNKNIIISILNMLILFRYASLSLFEFADICGSLLVFIIFNTYYLIFGEKIFNILIKLCTFSFIISISFIPISIYSLISLPVESIILLIAVIIISLLTVPSLFVFRLESQTKPNLRYYDFVYLVFALTSLIFISLSVILPKTDLFLFLLNSLITVITICFLCFSIYYNMFAKHILKSNAYIIALIFFILQRIFNLNLGTVLSSIVLIVSGILLLIIYMKLLSIIKNHEIENQDYIESMNENINIFIYNLVWVKLYDTINPDEDGEEDETDLRDNNILFFTFHAIPILLVVGVFACEILSVKIGTPVRFEVTGYDPRDLLRGHYIEYLLDEDVKSTTLLDLVDYELEQGSNFDLYTSRSIARFKERIYYAELIDSNNDNVYDSIVSVVPEKPMYNNYLKVNINNYISYRVFRNEDMKNDFFMDETNLVLDTTLPYNSSRFYLNEEDAKYLDTIFNSANLIEIEGVVTNGIFRARNLIVDGEVYSSY